MGSGKERENLWLGWGLNPRPSHEITIGHFRVHLILHFKARLSAKSLLWKSVFIHMEIATNNHNKNFALRLALKERLRATRKWPIARPTELQRRPEQVVGIEIATPLLLTILSISSATLFGVSLLLGQGLGLVANLLKNYRTVESRVLVQL